MKRNIIMHLLYAAKERSLLSGDKSEVSFTILAEVIKAMERDKALLQDCLKSSMRSSAVMRQQEAEIFSLKKKVENEKDINKTLLKDAGRALRRERGLRLEAAKLVQDLQEQILEADCRVFIDVREGRGALVNSEGKTIKGSMPLSMLQYHGEKIDCTVGFMNLEAFRPKGR